MRIFVAVNVYNDEARSVSFSVCSFLSSLGIDADCVGSIDMHAGASLPDIMHGASPAEYDMAIVLGGDGTILRAARLFRGYPIPILGINFGSFGFLANSSEPGVLHIVEEALAGNVTIERRTNIALDVYCGEPGKSAERADDGMPQSPHRTLFALNEVALNRGSYGGLIDMDLMIAGNVIATLKADGIVVSTATGSTGYALSAGGPLVSPGYRGLLTVPIAPHTLRSRAVVAAPEDVIEVVVKPMRNGKGPVLSTDGEGIEFPESITRIVARAGDVPTSLIYYNQGTFYQHVKKYFF